MQRLQLAIQNIRFARDYTVRLLDQTDQKYWFAQPQEGVTHIAWQVGHLAMAQYRLALERIRGSRAEDEALISASFLKLFGKESIPDPNPGVYPQPAEIRTVFDRVHEQTLAELPQLSVDELELPPLKPHSLFNTKRESLLWTANHEMVHAGQIGLLRRLIGLKSLW